jgi:hypothetical protein
MGAPILDLGIGRMLRIVWIEKKASVHVALDTLEVFLVLTLEHFLADILSI